jgi:electron transport complex protein RnfD
MSKKTGKHSEKFLTDSLLILTGLMFVAVYYYGGRAFAIIALAVFSAVISGAVIAKISGKPFFSNALPDLVSGLIVGLMFPAQTPYTTVIIAALFASLICRALFGGFLTEPASPSAVSYLFIYYTFGSAVFLCPPIFESLPLSSEIYPETLSPSFFSDILSNGVTDAPVTDLLFGRLPFYLGGGAVIILLIAVIFFSLRRDISFTSLFLSLGIFSGIALLSGQLGVKSTLFAASALLFPVIFCIMPPTRRFHTFHAKILYGIAAGLVLSAFVIYAKSAAGGFFAAVLLSPLAVFLTDNDFSFTQFLPEKLRYVKLEKL